MAEQAIVTQTGLAGLQFILGEIVEDLSAHVNASTSKAHAIDSLYFPGGLLDAQGNDISKYYNARGYEVGDRQIRLTVNNTVYYAPAKTTGLDGQPSNTGAINVEDVGSELNTAGGCTWVTQFQNTFISDAQSIRTDVLVPHTRKGHWEAHSPIAVFPKLTYDSAGFVVGTYVALVQWGGVVYEIPCDKRLGGPVQLYIITEPPDQAFASNSAPEYSILGLTVGGTLPITYQWQMETDISVGTWTDLIDGGGTLPFPWYCISGATTVSVKMGSNNNPGDTYVGYFRCKISNSSFSIYSRALKLSMHRHN